MRAAPLQDYEIIERHHGSHSKKNARYKMRCRGCGLISVKSFSNARSGRCRACYDSQRRPALTYRVEGDVAVCLTSNGHTFIIDIADLELVKTRAWYGRRSGGRVYIASGGINLQRVLMDAPAGCHVDHINRNTADNRRCNLRLCSPKENARNRTRRSGSEYTGVERRGKRFSAYITVDYKKIHLGRFDTAEEAARCRDAHAKNAFADFAVLNFPEVADEDPAAAP